MHDFLYRALFAGLGLALIAGPLGCFVVWRRMAYFGAAVSHSALLGVALGIALGLNLSLGILLFSLLLALLLFLLERGGRLSTDTLLGILAHGALAAGLIMVSVQESLRVNLMGYLLGDILAVSAQDLWMIAIGCGLLLVVLVALWRPLLSLTVDRELAIVEGHAVTLVELLYTLMVAACIAVGMRIVGILLVVSMLIIPAATARHLAANPESMAVIASLLGMLSVLTGILASFQWDLPSGPSIVLAATLLFAIVYLLPFKRRATRVSGAGTGP